MSETIYRLRRAMEDMPKEYMGFRLSCLPSDYDPRDYKYSKLLMAVGAPETPPGPIDYRPNLPGVFDQGQRGTCVAAATVWTVKAFQELNQGDYPAVGLSAAFLYAMCKALDEMPNDEGTTIRAAMQVAQKFGVCSEDIMPYSAVANLPAPVVPAVPDAAKVAAEKFKIQTYAHLCSMSDSDRSLLLSTIRQALKKEGPFVLALLVYENFEPDKSGRLPLPEGHSLGGHAVGIVGDLPDEEALILRNSWGEGWGQNGYALLPYQWITSRDDSGWYVFEAWTATDIVVPKPASRLEITPGAKTMFVDDQQVALDQPAVVVAETKRMLLPVRAVAGNMGYIVNWDGTKAVLTKPN
jgi:hypothetical protein